jgi:hypothetical protein
MIGGFLSTYIKRNHMGLKLDLYLISVPVNQKRVIQSKGAHFFSLSLSLSFYRQQNGIANKVKLLNVFNKNINKNRMHRLH